MATIFKRTKSGIDFYSPKEVEPPKKELAHLMAISRIFTPEELAAKMEMLKGESADGDEVEGSIESLEAISSRYELLAPMARDTRNAQVELAVTLLNEKVDDLDEHLRAIKRATGESWSKMRLWCDVPAEGAGAKKTGQTRVPTSVLRMIDAEVKEAQVKAAARRAKAEAKKSEAAAS